MESMVNEASESSTFAILLHEFAWVSYDLSHLEDGEAETLRCSSHLTPSCCFFLIDYHLPFFQGMEVAKRKKALRLGMHERNNQELGDLAAYHSW